MLCLHPGTSSDTRVSSQILSVIAERIALLVPTYLLLVESYLFRIVSMYIVHSICKYNIIPRFATGCTRIKGDLEEERF